jgi:hypothetical protein
MAAALFTGAGFALVTLFDDDGRLLVEETVEHAVDLVERRITAVVVSGTTGESWALDVDERRITRNSPPTPPDWRCWPTTSPPSRRPASPSRSSTSCRSRD